MSEFGFVNIPTPSTGLTYKGVWNALTNNPTLTSSVGTAGDYYIVSTAGTTNLDGITDWQIGDWAIFSSSGVWQKIDNSEISSYNTIQNEGVALTQQNILDFQGDLVTASDGGSKTIVTINSSKSVLYTVELVSALSVSFYAPFNLTIDSYTQIVGAATITIRVNGSPYVLGTSISAGAQITVTASVTSVVNLNCTQL